jgi:hypothetical protein
VPARQKTPNFRLFITFCQYYYLKSIHWAHFCVPGTQKPGFPLQFLGIAPRFLRDFRSNPLRGSEFSLKPTHPAQAAGFIGLRWPAFIIMVKP